MAMASSDVRAVSSLTVLQTHVETRVATGDEALLEEPPAPWGRGQIVIYLFSLVAFNSTVNGYDGSMIDTRVEFNIQQWLQQRNLGWHLCDHFGRRAGMASGAALVITGKSSLMIFLFGAAFSIGITPLQGRYLVEVLSFEMRAKGMVVSNLAVNLAGLLNQYAWSVSMKNLGWKTYIIFTVWHAISVIIVYFTLPETMGTTLQELDHIFAAKNPVEASISKKVIVRQDGHLVEVEEA
ncbi:sugar transporter (hexose transporter) [Metarhizium album ARSEF 1941]|uniref:Sugar transporter (Hexose transporter) n=1 Tax=Metarhizium album (strain ARSEF 1941) TaxID=1081103 RepID=A0A0B2WKG7_METAS|nr:sugar transporter (hexose transporter) [Metarhizium album ARSEF 1941]KHN93972.1 sugar transporter (hexose transporter) [Metarhizium album ARSEF 1941]